MSLTHVPMSVQGVEGSLTVLGVPFTTSRMMPVASTQPTPKLYGCIGVNPRVKNLTGGL